jgi:hypothetical protein
MPKRVALKDHVTINAVDLSNFARSVRYSSESEQVDVSGFNPAGSNEYIAGPMTQTLTVEFYGSYGTAEVHQTLYPIHKNRTVVPVAWRPDSAIVGASNPELRGNAQLLSYGPGAERGSADTFEATFTQADAAGFDFFTT